MGVGPVSVGVSAPAVQLGALDGGGGEVATRLWLPVFLGRLRTACACSFQPGLHFSTNVDKEEDGCGGS